MNSQRLKVLILDLDRMPCSSGNCEQLPLFMRKAFPTLQIHQYHSFPQGSLQDLEQTDLIFLRTSSLSNLSQFIQRARDQICRVPVIGVLCVDHEVECSQASSWLTGLDDFLCCPLDQLDVVLRIQQFHCIREEIGEALGTGQVIRDLCTQGLVGMSTSFLETVGKIPQIAISEATTLISGETGTGKEVVARAIHYSGPRKEHPFVPINCGALPDHLFENEVFGHTKGAFTDAIGEQKGLIQEAEGGTVFLDEIDALSPASQIKLLRFLQDREYRALGSAKTLKANVRILSATNQDLKGLVQEGRFREDLYYRVNTLSLVLPPLRNRMEDIPALVHHILKKTPRPNSEAPPIRLSPGAMRKLFTYTWPGNVRELESVVCRAITFHEGPNEIIHEIQLPALEQVEMRPGHAFTTERRKTLENFERNYLINLLTDQQGNISQAAKAAGKERRTFKRLLAKHHLDRKAFLTMT